MSDNDGNPVATGGDSGIFSEAPSSSAPSSSAAPAPASAEVSESLGDCSVVGLLPFTNEAGELPMHYGLGNRTHAAFTHMAAALMAADHFNARDPAVVPELADDLYAECSVRLPTVHVDGDGNNEVGGGGGAAAMRMLDTRASKYGTARALSDLAAAQATATGAGDPGRRVCALAGPYGDDPATTASTYALGLDIPLVAHGPTELGFGRGRFPRSAATTVNLHIVSDVIVNHMVSRGRTDFLATVGVSKEVGDQFRETIDNSAKDMGFSHIRHYIFSPPYTGYDTNALGYAMREIAESGYRNIFVVMSNPSTQLEHVANYAMEHGLLDGERFWMVAAEGGTGSYLSELAWLASTLGNDNVTKLVRGMAAVKVLDGFEFDPEGDRFLREWRKKDGDFVERLNAMHPIQDEKAPGYFRAGMDYFRTAMPERGAGYMYDAVMTIGMGRCLQEAKEREEEAARAAGGPARRIDDVAAAAASAASGNVAASGGGSRARLRRLQEAKEREDASAKPRDAGGGKSGARRRRRLQPKAFAPPNRHFQSIVEAKFTGATGRVEYKAPIHPFPGRRHYDTVTMGVFNFREIEEAEGAGNPNFNTWFYLTDIHTGPPLGGNWTAAPGAPFVFASGLPTPPARNNDLPDQNYLGRGVHITGLTFMSVALVLTLSSAVLVASFRNVDPFRPAQPEFLLLLMLGAATMSFAMLTMSFDESYGWTEPMLDAACMATPWLVALGYNTVYLALFSKLWRIDQVLQTRFRAVSVRAALGPLAAAVAATVAVLVGWTASDPLRWERRVIDENTLESVGECACRHSAAFLVPLGVLGFVSTAACGAMAYKCRDIDSRFSESNQIFYTIFVQVQVLLVGIPVLVILDEGSAEARYLGRTLIIFVVVVTTVGFMIGPKAATLVRRKRQAAGRATKRSRTRGGGGGNVHVSGTNQTPGTLMMHMSLGSSIMRTVERVNTPPQRQCDGNVASGSGVVETSATNITAL